MNLGLRGKACLVTGASSGIGRVTAVMLAGEGARVVGTARSEAAFAAVADEVRAVGGARTRCCWRRTSPKTTLESWSKMASGTYAARVVTVNCVSPGRLNTVQILERLQPTEEARQAYIAQNIQAGRFGEARDAAAVIAFLASDRAGYVTGTTIPVDGGALRFAF